jgi:tripartite-type tricarboxylate transporter receptor subunit TctC
MFKALTLSVLFTISPLAVLAQSYPSKPIRLVAAQAAGGANDVAARMVANELTRALGQQVVVDNRPGAGGTIAAELVAKAPADGYTLLVNSAAHAIAPSLYKTNYDTSTDFAPITVFATIPDLLTVHPAVPVKSVSELIAHAKAHPGKLLWATSGNGSPQHLRLELFKLMTGVDVVHVPYKGTAASLTDLISGRVSMTVASVPSALPYVKSGQLRALATLGKSRSALAPDYPTMVEAGVPGLVAEQWNALFAPAKTPISVISLLNGLIVKTLAQPEFRERLLKSGFEPIGSKPAEASGFIAAEIARWAKVIKQAGVRAD